MTNNPKRVSTSEPMAKPTRTLVEHTVDVVTAFVALFGTPDEPTPLTRRWLAFFKLTEDDLRPFLRNTLLSCRLHDWGKANTGFAAMLVKTGKQAVRHEVVSALIMTQPTVWCWLESIEGVDLPLVLAAVSGHHLKAGEPETYEYATEFGATQPDAHASEIYLTWHHPKVREQLGVLAREFTIAGELPDGVPEGWSLRGTRLNPATYETDRNRLRDRIVRFQDDIGNDHASPRSRMLRAVRSALIAADSAGSALFRTHGETGRTDQVGDHIRQWIADAFDPAGALDEATINEAVIDPRTAGVVPNGQPFPWNEFQDACDRPDRVPARALLIAPCGSGKTLAAWRWVAARCRERPVARAIFLYPTRGTATEGFRDYVSHAGDKLAALVHGTAELDLDELRPDSDLETRIAESRLFSLQQWPKRIFSATIDQFLAFLQHDYGSTCLLPLLADSALVLDEVHSYDRGVFTAVTQLLEHFDIPVLAMTATMPERRKTDLARHLAVVNGLGFSGDESRLRLIADHKRYAVAKFARIDEAGKEAESALRAGLRVLWVVNRVDRAQELAKSFADDPRAGPLRTSAGVPILCYHSRFKLRDRRDRHDAIVAAFKTTPGRNRGAVLGITTQVCEMSLDLDCDVLITEYSPISSLIQRFGRCCRDQEAHESGRIGRVFLYEPDSIKPYDKKDMENVPAFVTGIAGSVVSQSDLEERLTALGGAGYLKRNARFLTDGPWASAGEEQFRDAEEFTGQALIPGDEEEYQRLLKSRAKWRAQEYIVPIPKCDRDKSNSPPWMPSWLSFADVKRHEYLASLGYIVKVGGGHQTA